MSRSCAPPSNWQRDEKKTRSGPSWHGASVSSCLARGRTTAYGHLRLALAPVGATLQGAQVGCKLDKGGRDSLNSQWGRFIIGVFTCLCVWAFGSVLPALECVQKLAGHVVVRECSELFLFNNSHLVAILAADS